MSSYRLTGLIGFWSSKPEPSTRALKMAMVYSLKAFLPTPPPPPLPSARPLRRMFGQRFPRVLGFEGLRV